MEISELKEQLNILSVAQELGITIEKGDKAKCPFHKDKTPSLQFSKEKQICTCFSSKCTAGTMDVIQLVEKKLNLSTHQAINYLTQQVIPKEITQSQKDKETINYSKDFEQQQSSYLASSTARKYTKQRHLNEKTIKIGYNAYKNSKYNYLRGCIIFPLKNKKGQIVSLYGRSIRDNDKAKHYYTKNRQGLYPSYPKEQTKTLLVTESIIDTATLISNSILPTNYSILSFYGTEGFKEQTEAIQQLEALEEVIIFFDGDTPGQQGAEKLAKTLQEIKPGLTLKIVPTPQDEDINSLLDTHEPQILAHLIKESKPFLSCLPTRQVQQKPAKEILKTKDSLLNTQNPNNITYTTETAHYQIKGGIRKDLDSLKVTLVIEHLEYKTKSRNKLDLYEDKQTEKISREASEKLNLRADLVERDLNILTDLLDQYREENTEQVQESKQVILSKEQKEKCIKFLKTAELLFKINDLIGKSGVVGEHDNRVFLFVIASSYKMSETLHALIQGSSGSGKTHLLNTIMDFMPPEDTISLTRVTESSFYNYGQYELQNKLIGMEDFDGLEEKAELAFRELQSKGMISSSTSGKNESTGKIEGYVKEVFGPIASLSATTKGEIYEDNMSRSFLVAVDESKEQTMQIIRYQNERAAGLIDKEKEKGTRAFLRNCMRLLAPFEVINPFANKIDLPGEAHKIRRLNDLFQSFIKQVTLLNQYQRNKDTQGRLITDKEDVKTAIAIMFDSIILKVDELDGSLREFYEKLKKYVLSKSKEYEFTRREIRHETKTSNTQLHRFMKQLLDLEYIYQSSGYDNRGHKYKIAYWDNMEALRNRIKQDLNNQLDKL